MSYNHLNIGMQFPYENVSFAIYIIITVEYAYDNIEIFKIKIKIGPGVAYERSWGN